MKLSIIAFVVIQASALSVYSATYSFNQSVELVRKNNYEILSAKENLKAAEFSKSSQFSKYLPSINANLSYSKSGVEEVESEGFSAGLSASQNLFNGFADSAAVKEAEGRVLVAKASLQEIQAKVSYDLKVAFAGIIYAQDALKLSESIVSRRSENLNMIRLRFQGGRENKGSVLLAEANFAQAKLDLLKSQNQFEVSKSQLRNVLGLSPNEDFSVSGIMPEPKSAPPRPDFQSLVATTPQFLQAKGRIQSAEASLTATRANFLPSLDVTGSMGQNGSQFFPDQQDRWAVGASLTWPLFNGGRDYFASKSAFSQKIVAESNWKNTELEILANLKQSHTAFVEALEQYKVSTAFAEAGIVRTQITRSKYNNGLSSFDEWDRIESDLIGYQKDQTARKRDRIIYEANWEKSQGLGVL